MSNIEKNSEMFLSSQEIGVSKEIPTQPEVIPIVEDIQAVVLGQIDADSTKLEAMNEEIKNVNNSVNLSPEEVSEIKDSIGLDAKILDIDNKAKQLTKEIKEKITSNIEIGRFEFKTIKDSIKNYAELKADDKLGFTMPIDTLIDRFVSEGIKVVYGKNPGSRNIFILPQGSDNIEEESIFFSSLQIIPEMPVELQKLILEKK